MEPLLFTDENAPEWAFSKRKGLKVEKHTINFVYCIVVRRRGLRGT